MSEAVSALKGARYEGRVSVSEAGLTGMVLIRGEIDATAQAVADATGCGVPDTLGIDMGDAASVAWMSPDELLVICDYETAPELARTLAEALDGMHALVANVSDARAVFALDGDDGALRDVLAKLTPADLAPDACPVGMIRRTRLAQVSAAIWFTEPGSARVICFRSVATYVFDLLTTAAADGGRVGFFEG